MATNGSPGDGVSIEALSDEFGIPEDDVRELVDAAITQFDTQVSDFMKGEARGADDVTDLSNLIIANALDMALPRGVERETGRRLLRTVVDPRLERIATGEAAFDPVEATGRVAERSFPIQVREGAFEEGATAGDPSEDADAFQRALEDLVAGKLAQMDCGELKRRLLDLTDLAAGVRQRGVVMSGVQEDWRQKSARLHFAAHRAGCIRQTDKNQLDRLASSVARNIGSKAGVERAQEYDRVIRNAFSGSAAGMGLR